MKTTDILLIGGLAALVYFLVKGVPGVSGDGGGSGGSGGALPPPESGPGSKDDPSGQYTPSTGTLFYKGLGYSTAYPQEMVNQLSAGSSALIRSSGSAVTTQQMGVSVARSFYAAQTPPSGVAVARAVYSGSFGTPSVPADIMTGQSIGVGIGSPFIPGVLSKPTGFK